MTKRLVYILMLLLFAARVSLANTGHVHRYYIPADKAAILCAAADTNRVKTVPQSHMDVLGVKKIKEIAKPKHQSKPEKVTVPVDTAAVNKKDKRQRRPEGVERPPEIPRRNND